MPVEDGSPHALGAIQTKRCTYRESSKPGKSVIGLFCLLGMAPEFRLTDVSLVQRMCVLSGAKRLTGCYCVVARRFYSLLWSHDLMTYWGNTPVTSWNFHVLRHIINFLYSTLPSGCFHGDVGC